MTLYSLPSGVAARITIDSLAATQRLIAAVGSLIAAVTVVEVLHSRGVTEGVEIVVAPFLGMAVLALVLLWWPTAATAGAYILGGTVLSVAVAVLGMSIDPQFDEPGPYLINRIATAVCFVGAVSGSAVSGIVWTALGFAAAQSSVLIGLSLSGASTGPGFGPAIVALIALAAYSALALARRRSDSRAPEFANSRARVREADRRRELELRAAGIVHDTILADLDLIARLAGLLPPRSAEVLGEHLAAIHAGTVADPMRGSMTGSAFGRALLDLARDYQWSGVRVDVSGAETLDAEVSPLIGEAVLGATRAALDNVVSHARTDSAEIVAGIRDDHLMVLVVDDGSGFDPEAIAEDRIGVRLSIEERIRQVGGRVRLWSGPDGTTVMLTVPIGGEVR